MHQHVSGHQLRIGNGHVQSALQVQERYCPAPHLFGVIVNGRSAFVPSNHNILLTVLLHTHRGTPANSWYTLIAEG